MTSFAALVRHPLAIAGVLIATAAGVSFVVLTVAGLAGLVHNPYAWLVVFIGLPALLVLGLLLIAAGTWLERRRLAHQSRAADWLVLDLRRTGVRRTVLIVSALTLINVSIILLAGYGSLHYMESPTFCGQVCHTPMRPQFTAWQMASHAGTECVQCHVGDGPRAFLRAKLAGVRQLRHVIANSYPRPIPPGADMPPGAQAATCRGCHRPEQAVGDRIRVVREYADDEANTETKTVLQMHLGAGSASGRAIHWHADPAIRVEYAATGEGNETIPYVKLTKPDGRVTEYLASDADATATAAVTPPPTTALRRMDCIDCHNTVGHPMAPSAAQAVDQAIAFGQISRQLPYVRREGIKLLTVAYDSDEAAMTGIDRDLRRFYASYGDAIDAQAIARTVTALQAQYRRAVFPSMKVTWGAYPTQKGHTTATGCFRCHDDSHKDKTGATISGDCEYCHTQVQTPP
jgi:hypothetical protein